jgi:hypothetical protein
MICSKTFTDKANKRRKCHACRMSKIECKSELCKRLIYKANATTGYCASCVTQRERNPNWRGGQIKHQQGYVMVRTKDRGYVFQHRLVMEEHLGRELLPSENVHHKNGVRNDNSLDNLELWTTKQPSGQRVSDLVRWAEEVLTLYKGA